MLASSPLPAAPMDFLTLHDRLVSLGGSEAHAERRRELRERFQTRTGHYTADDPWFEARSRAFWDDALTSGGLALELAPELGEDCGPLAERLATAHRGLFECIDVDRERAVVLDAWTDVELEVTLLDDSLRPTLTHSAGSEPQSYFDGRVVASEDPLVVALLPGALFHPPDASEAIDRVLEAAAARGMSGDEALDALMRMELRFRSMSRMKAAFSYKAEALVPGAPSSTHKLPRA